MRNLPLGIDALSSDLAGRREKAIGLESATCVQKSGENTVIIKPGPEIASSLSAIRWARRSIGDTRQRMSPVTPPIRPDHKRSRTPAIVGLSITVFLLFGVIFSQATFNLTFLQPDTSEETLIFAALSALIFLLFVALTFVCCASCCGCTPNARPE